MCKRVLPVLFLLLLMVLSVSLSAATGAMVAWTALLAATKPLTGTQVASGPLMVMEKEPGLKLSLVKALT